MPDFIAIIRERNAVSNTLCRVLIPYVVLGSISKGYGRQRRKNYMNKQTRVRLLGLPSVRSGSFDAPLPTTRPMQLFTYLAVQRTWQRRSDLAALLWPDHPSAMAYSNLRNLLFKTVAAAPYARIESTDHAIRVGVSSDLDDLEAAEAGGHSRKVVALGGNDLLLGFENLDGDSWQNWLQRERDALVARWVAAVRALIGQRTLSLSSREQLGRAWAARCSYDEEPVHACIALAFESNKPHAAAELFHAFAARQRREFGVSPSNELKRYALRQTSLSTHAGMAINFSATLSTKQSASNLQPITGRRHELRQLTTYYLDETVRIVYLTGPGGVGKSTLLTELYRNSHSEDGTRRVFVNVSSAENASAVIRAVGHALGVDELRGEGNEVALAALLRDGCYHLMLDGAEQDDLAAPLLLLLERCPHTRVVVTSRNRPQFVGAKVLELDGFPLPDLDENDPDLLAVNDGVRYFTEQMSAAGCIVNLASDGPEIAALVHAVDGVPLALKLLSALTRVFSLRDLLANVRNHLSGSKDGVTPALKELMPALLTSFESSWRATTPVERTVLSRLAVFPAPFDLMAAREVGQTELSVITSLLDRSLLRVSETGRISLHATIRACVFAVSPPAPFMVEAYLNYYARRLKSQSDIGKHESIRPLHQLLREDGHHVAHVWHVALSLRSYSILLVLAESLWFIADGVGARFDLETSLVAAERALRDDPETPLALRALLLASAARSSYFQGQIATTVERARAAMRMALRSRHQAAFISASDSLIRYFLAEGKFREAEALMARVAAQRPMLNSGDFFTTFLLAQQRILSFYRSDFNASIRLAEQMADVYERYGDSDSVVRVLIGKAFSYAESDDLVRAIQVAERAAAINGASATHVATLLCEAAYWNLELTHTEEAQSCLARVDACASICPSSPFLHLKICQTRAAVAVSKGDIAQAAIQLEEALGALIRGEELGLAEPIFLVTAKWFLLVQHHEPCVDLLRAIPAQLWERRTFQTAQKLLRQLGADTTQLPAAKVTDTAAFALRTVQKLRSSMNH